MADKNDPQAVLLLNVLQEPDPKKAREQYCRAFEIDEIKDHAIYHLIESRVFNAILSNESTVEIEIELAQTMLLLLKNGIKRSKGGQPNSRHQELRKRTLVTLGRQIKTELIDGGMDATQALLEAADAVAAEGKSRGIEYAPGFLKREMENADR
ncbi:MAG: hypothetical protein OEM91_17785 [Hyphomicrobiales bacterium]|nr:hypothetical protein [Hyphomicrobiales bacterium]